MAKEDAAVNGLSRHMALSLGKVVILVGIAATLIILLLERHYDYGDSPLGIDKRTLVWFFAEIHLMFAAFVLGVPIFAMIAEVVGIASKDARYDRLAREFTRLLALAFTTTAVLGTGALLLLLLFYPRAMMYLDKVFADTYIWYVVCIVGDTVLLVLYYYGWDWLSGKKKWLHVGVGLALNLLGTVLLCVANAWATFMMSPSGVDPDTGALVSVWDAVNNPLWWPINIHRLLANVAFGGAIAAAYAAVRFLSAKTDQDRAHYDWMGYFGNMVAMFALIPLPFAGYWLGKEIYAYSAQMGTQLMGGSFSWLFIIQAVLIATLFISANYYMWLGLGRIPGGSRFMKYIIFLEMILFLCIAVWMTPHSLVATLAEARAMGGAHHPVLGVFGVMSAKNTVVNIIILVVFVSFILYRRANKRLPAERPPGGVMGPTFVMILAAFPVLFCGVSGYLSHARDAEVRVPALEAQIAATEADVLKTTQPLGEKLESLKNLSLMTAEVEQLRKTPGIHHVAAYRVLAVLFFLLLVAALVIMFGLKGRGGLWAQNFIILIAAGIVVYFGVKGYFVEAEVRIGFSVYQVMAVLFAMLAVMGMDLFIFFGSESIGTIEWGKMPRRSQYVLVLLAFTFTLLMGLMGFVRSGIRETWHVYGVLRDTSKQAFTPTMGYGTTVIAVTSLVFFAIMGVLFWLGLRRSEAKEDA